MKKIFFFIAFVFFVQAARSQIFIRPNQSFGLEYYRGAFDSTVYIPTGSSAPVGKAGLRSYGFAGAGQTLRMSALYYDSTNKILYAFSPKDSSWGPAGGGTIVDTSLFLRKALNLSEVASISSARTNLGLGSLALLNTINNTNWSGTPLSPGNGGTGLNALGTAFQMLRINSGATALEYFTPTFQPQLNGTGFVKASGTTISYDNSNYISALTGDVTASGPGSAAATLASIISASSCTLCNLTFDAKGRITVAANGASGGTTWSGVIGGSSATSSNLTIPNSGAFVQYVLNGTTSRTFTLPAFASNGNRAFFFKNASSATLTIQAGGSDNIYTNAVVTSFTLAPGESGFVISSPTYWYAYTSSGGSQNIDATLGFGDTAYNKKFFMLDGSGNEFAIMNPAGKQMAFGDFNAAFNGTYVDINDNTQEIHLRANSDIYFEMNSGVSTFLKTQAAQSGVGTYYFPNTPQTIASRFDTLATLYDIRNGGANFANTDLTFTGDRTHDLANNILNLNNGKEFNVNTSNGTQSIQFTMEPDDVSTHWEHDNIATSTSSIISLGGTTPTISLTSTSSGNTSIVEVRTDGTIRLNPQGTSGHSAGEVWTLVIPATGEGGWLPNPANLSRTNITSGTSSTLSSGNLLVQFDFSSVTGTYNLTLPGSPNDKDIIEIQTGKTISGGNPEISTFTLIPNGSQTLNFAAPITTLNSGESIIIMYNASGDFWSRRN